ncbi:MAG: hypothetical protein ABI895_20800 [Deltaproteobacteria bacterium]
MSQFRVRRPAFWALCSALCWALASLACGGKNELGSVMLAISTDMYVDKDVSRVDIIVQPEHGPAQSTQVNLFPALEGLLLPGTFSIIEGSDPGEFVRVRLVARQSDRARVVREAALKVPQRRTALLTMPIQWLCDGRVRQEGQQSRSDCDEGYTCVSGSCKLDEVNEALLPSYQSEEVFGGGNATGGGSCFDTLPCFEQHEQVALDVERCVLDTPVTDDLNVAALLPPGGDGHCMASGCWIPLDASAFSGWSPAESGNRVQLPEGLCERVRAGTTSVRISHSCPSKTPSTPTCGPWTLVGTEPGQEPDGKTNTGAPTALTDSEKLGEELATLSQELSIEVARACASLTQASPPALPSPADLNSICQLAKVTLAPSAPLTWYHLPARCWPDAERQLSCEAACSSSCNPGTLADRCEASSLAGTCVGPCDSRQCLGSEPIPTTCAGACDGNVAGACQGICLGRCSTGCATPTADGSCDAHCDGICTGLCIGRVDGSCQGHCDGDPMLPAAPCSAGTLCLGACSTQLSEPRCASQLGNSPCALDGCSSDCTAIGRIDSSCDPATVWLLPPPGLDLALGAVLPGSLADLITIRDSRGGPALDEAKRWRDRLSNNTNTAPGALESAQKVLDLLTAVMNGASAVLDAVGPARQGSVPGGAPSAVPPAFSCDIKKSPALVPLIDDFEDGDAQLLLNDGRTGSWSVGQDGTGTLSTPVPPVPADGGANGTGRAMHLAGSGFSQWGANLTLELRSGASPYDASAHRGIRFSARGSGRLRVIFMQQNLAPGHPCSTCDTAGGECGLLYSTDISLSDVWSPIIVDWPILLPPTQISTPFAPDQLMTIQFEAPAPDPFDIWIDDLSFDGP